MRLTSVTRLISNLFLVMLLLLTWCSMFASALAQGIVHPYRTPQAVFLQSALNAGWDKPIIQQPLLGLVQEWSIGNGISVWIDRRIATDAVITVSEIPNTLEDAISQVAQAIQADVAIIDRIVMLVPEGRAECIEQAYWSLATSNMPGPLLRVEKTGMAWEDGASAEGLIKEFLQRYRIEDLAAEPIERDLWRAHRWEQVTPAAVGLCLLSGFDLRLEAEGDRVVICPLCNSTDPSKVAWTYREEIQKVGRDAWQEWRNRWEVATVERQDRAGAIQWRITAPIQAHRELVAPLAPPATRTLPANPKSQRFTGRFRGELQLILKSLANQVKLELVLPDLPEQVLRQELDLNFQEETFDEIVEKIVFASGLAIRRDGDQLKVDAK